MLKVTIKNPFSIFFPQAFFRQVLWFTPLSFSYMFFLILPDISVGFVRTQLFKKIILRKEQDLKSPLDCNLCSSVYHPWKITPFFFSGFLPETLHRLHGVLERILNSTECFFAFGSRLYPDIPRAEGKGKQSKAEAGVYLVKESIPAGI